MTHSASVNRVFVTLLPFYFLTILLHGKHGRRRRRIREAHGTGAHVLAVGCPKCLVMLEDAVKAEGLENKLRVRDIAEIVAEAC
jgi:hypothetical protein